MIILKNLKQLSILLKKNKEKNDEIFCTRVAYKEQEISQKFMISSRCGEQKISKIIFGSVQSNSELKSLCK
jgi:hypothetical protein